MYECAQHGYISAVKLLHKRGADISRPRDNGETPAFAAASGGHAGVVQLLSDLGADVNRANDGGKSGMILELFMYI